VTVALLIDLDGALGDTRPLWDAWLADAERVLPVDTRALPADRGLAANALDDAGAGNWRALLGRFAEDRAPIYLRPDATTSAALRQLAGSGVRLGAFTDAPAELADLALAQLGAARRLERIEAGTNALERLRAALGEDAPLVRTRAELSAYAWPAAPPTGADRRRA
jgi:phosphoglycolate phosphatase-like HAD superfamily hydrolase